MVHRHIYSINGSGEIDFRSFVEISRDHFNFENHKVRKRKRKRKHHIVQDFATQFLAMNEAIVDFHERTHDPQLVVNNKMPDEVRLHLEKMFFVELGYGGMRKEHDRFIK